VQLLYSRERRIFCRKPHIIAATAILGSLMRTVSQSRAVDATRGRLVRELIRHRSLIHYQDRPLNVEISRQSRKPCP
jgi:hypothetical protein